MKALYERLSSIDIYPEHSDTDIVNNNDNSDNELKDRIIRVASDIKTEWGDLVDDYALQVVESKSRYGKIKKDLNISQQMKSEEKKGNLELTIEKSDVPESKNRTTINKSEDVLVKDLSSLNKVKEEKHQVETSNNIVNKTEFNLLSYLQGTKFEVIDKRPLGGSLWIVGGNEISNQLTELKKNGVQFIFAKNGSKSTKNRPAWFTTSKK
jgi:hypothetical protein